VDWYLRVFELIDLRSFSNLWFWIMLAVLWSRVSHNILGVPYDMVTRARRRGGQVAEDVATLATLQARRYAYIADVAGHWLLGLAGFLLASAATVGFGYGYEIGQALFLLFLPLVLVALLTARAARRIRAEAPEGPALWKRLRRLRLAFQMIGLFSIFVTAFWGMWHNMTYSALGG